MNLNEIKKKANGMGVKTNNLKKADLIRAIQKAEKNFDCYAV